MKKTKKILSLILAIIMIVSTVPMAFAYNYDYDAYMQAYLDFIVYTSNVYEQEDADFAIALAYGNAFNKVIETYPYLETAFGNTEKLDEMPEAANAITAALNEVTATIEENIAAGTFGVIIDTRKAVSSYYRASMTYTEEEMTALIDKIPAEISAKAEASARACDTILEEAALDNTLYTQADYDAAAADMIEFYTQFTDCLGGIHKFGVCTDNGDGTHTKTCVFCTTTDSTIHNYEDGTCVCGAKEPVIEDDTNDDTNVDTDNNKTEDNTDTEDTKKESGIKAFFQKIADFFKNIFNKLFGWMKK